MAYNKSKYVESAQKLLNQGKVVQAIAEYQQILKHEPRDQVTLMTVGELYIRQGETFQAIEYFERLAQIFVGDGFLTKAIAVYKRIAKLAPEEIRPLEKLADLYVQQGVMSEARPLFLQLAEIHLKAHRQPEAIALLKKLLLAEPDNLRIQVRLGDLYQAMGQAKEAADTYVSAAQRALARGDQGECEKLADKALKLDANSLPAAIIKARAYSSQGRLAEAAQLLEKAPDLEKGGEPAELLIDLYVKNVNWQQASELSLRIFDADVKNFGLAQKVAEALLESGQAEKAMAIVERTRIAMLDAGEHEVVTRLLNALAERLPGRIEPHEMLVDTYGRISDSFRLPDALAQLGGVLADANQLDRAKQVFEQLVERQPESDAAKRKLSEVLVKMGLLAPQDAPVPAAETLQTSIPEPRPAKPLAAQEVSAAEVHAKPTNEVDAPPDADTLKFITQSFTDVDLFASYGLTQKAIGLLEAILRRAPRHTPTLEKLLDFVLGAGDDQRTAQVAYQLEQINTERGDSNGAERFGELRRRFQRAANLSDDELVAAFALGQGAGDSAIREVTAEAVAAEPDSAHAAAEVANETHLEAVPLAADKSKDAGSGPLAETAVHEVDLSDEWASLLNKSPIADPMGEASREHVAKESKPAELIQAIPSPTTHAADSAYEEFELAPETSPEAELAEVVPPEVTASDTAATDLQAVEEPAPAPVMESAASLPTIELPVPTIEAALPATEAKLPATDAAVPSTPEAPEPEFELEREYELILDPEALVPAHEQQPPQVLHPIEREPVTKNGAGIHVGTGAYDSDKFLADLAGELDLGELTPSFSTPAKPTEAVQPQTQGTGDVGPLHEVFEDFRAELGEMSSADEDLETHYNLGIAFREMGLLEEAISEFQKVAQANERGRSFRYAMQCCTLLGLAFMEKGQPGIAAIWYERALSTPGVEPESSLALRYDLGVAQESAGEPEAALKSFSHVYAMNIDYRDVAERIAALQKPIR
ncbi:MAG: hypothetical protein NVS9B13_26750 [Candidatus Acidiferrum sp.]